MNLSSFSKIKTMSASALLLSLLISTSANAEEKEASAHSSNHMMAAPEMKKEMADMHQKMADCLRTEKSMQDCHGEMMKDCQGAKASGHCSMMDGMMKKGSMKHGKMKDKKADPSVSK